MYSVDTTTSPGSTHLNSENMPGKKKNREEGNTSLSPGFLRGSNQRDKAKVVLHSEELEQERDQVWLDDAGSMHWIFRKEDRREKKIGARKQETKKLK